MYTLKYLETLIANLNDCTPKRVPMDAFGNIDLVRAAILRESIFLRVRELAESARDACVKDRLISASILTRSLMETEAFFVYFMNEVEQALNKRDFNKIKVFLTKALRGARFEIANKQFGRPQPIHVMDAIRFLDKKIPNYEKHYDFLSEFSHPNSSGLNRAYSKNNWDNKEIVFGDNREKITIDYPIEQLGVSLEHFIVEYNRSAGTLEEWQLLSDKEPSLYQTQPHGS